LVTTSVILIFLMKHEI